MKNVAAALVKAQRSFGPALKSSTNPHFKSRYADLAACVEAVIDGLNQNGIALVQAQHECSDGVTVETIFVHESGETLSAGKLHVPAAKQDPQGYGSALTYARRYSLMAACGIAPEDDDGNAAKAPARGDRGVMGAVLRNEGALSPERQAFVQTFAQELEEEQLAGRTREWLCAQVEKAGLDDTEKMHLWSMLPSYVRTAMKPEQARPHVEKAALMPGLKKTGTRVTTEEAR